MSSAPAFSVIPGDEVQKVIAGRERQVTRVIETAYRLHGEGRTVNPDSYFLRFPGRSADRIIALPASVGGEVGVHGVKWVSSFPGNVARGLPRASAVVILNDAETGYPTACLDGSIISATRTAASAALAADMLSQGLGRRPVTVGFIGTGLIARYIHTYLTAGGFEFAETGVHDLSAEHAQRFADYLRRSGVDRYAVHSTAEELIRSSDLVVLATVAAEPHIGAPEWFEHGPLVLHISLRDLSPEVILAGWNVVDDVEHCMKARTSTHLTEQVTGGRGFIAGTLHDVLTGKISPPGDRPVIFSPFGLGVLDLTLAKYVHDQVAAAGRLLEIPEFFHDTERYGPA